MSVAPAGLESTKPYCSSVAHTLQLSLASASAVLPMEPMLHCRKAVVLEVTYHRGKALQEQVRRPFASAEAALVD